MTSPPILVLAALLAVALAACAGQPAQQDPPETAAPQMLASEDKDVTAALMAGEFAWQDGRAASAARHYARAAALSDDAAIAEHATRVSIVAREWASASESLARWKTLAPKAPGIVQAEAGIALGGNDSATALRHLRSLLARDDADSRRMVGQVLLASGEPDAAVGVLEQLVDTPGAGYNVETLLMLSQVAQQLRKPELAGQLATQAVERDPKSAPAALWRGHVSLRAGDRAAARAAFERAVVLAPDDKSTRLTYAALLNELDQAADAARTLDEIAPDDEVLAARAAYAARADDPRLLAAVAAQIEALPPPRPAERLELLGQLAELGERPADALRWYREIPRGERWFDAQLRIGVLLDASEGIDASLAHLASLRAEGIDDDGRLADTFLLEAELQGRRDAPQLAVDAYTRGLKVLPDERRLLYGRALLFEELDRVAECEADLRRIVTLHPEDPDALNALGYTLADRTDRYQEALELIDKALKLKPDEPAIIDSMGWVQYRLGRFPEAIKHLQRAFELQPDAEIAAHLGEVLWVSGQREQARAIWDKGAAIDADNRSLKETRSRLAP